MTITKRPYLNFILPLGVLLLCGVSAVPATAQDNNMHALPSTIAPSSPSSAAVPAETSSSVEIDTSVLGTLRSKTYEPAPYAPRSQQLKLHKPVSTGNDWLTTGIQNEDQIDEQGDDNSQNNTNGPKPFDNYVIIPKSQQPALKSPALDHEDTIIKGHDITAMPRKTSAIDIKQTEIPSAPAPAHKPVEAIKAAQEEKLARIPIPERRPVIQQASKSFVEQQRMHIAAATPEGQLVPPTVRKTMPMDPRILQNAPRSMPAAPSENVAVEPLHASDKVAFASPPPPPAPTQTQAATSSGTAKHSPSFTERMSEHKNRIIAAVQKIAGYRDEPDIDVDAYMADRQQLAKAMNEKDVQKPNMQRIDAKPLIKTIARIEPAAGAEAKLIHTPETRRTTATDGRMISVAFAPAQAAIDKDTKATINSKILPRLQTDTSLRIQLQSYASSPDKTNSLAARRLSLSRALAAREYLVTMGIDPRRVDLRPMGESTQAGTADRIDFLVYKP